MVELIGLLVPSVETGYRAVGDGWAFLIRTRGRHRATGRYRESFAVAKAQYLDDASVTARTPHAAALAGKHVTVVGCGAIGHHVATDLARGGVAGWTCWTGTGSTSPPAPVNPALYPASGSPRCRCSG